MAVNLSLIRPLFATGKYAPVSKLLHPSVNPMKMTYRNTIILKRRVPVPQYNKYLDPEYVKRHLDPIHEEYLVVEETEAINAPPIEIVLRKYVEDVGKPGQIVSLQPLLAYDLVILGEAYYATPENIAKVKLLAESEIDKHSSLTAYKTMKMMMRDTLSVYVNMDEPWTIEPWMIRVCFRMNGVQILNDDCIELPERPIVGPNMDLEGKDFAVHITINKCERFPVRCRLRHYTKIFSKRVVLLPDHECVPADPILPEQADLLKSIPLPIYKENLKMA